MPEADASSLLNYLSETLSKPGRAVRGLLSGRPSELANLIPFSDTMGLTDPAQSVTGRSLLENLGALSPKAEGEGFGLGDVAGFAADVATDPLNYAGGWLAKRGIDALRGARAGKAAAVAEAASPIAKAVETAPASPLVEGMMPRQLAPGLVPKKVGENALLGNLAERASGDPLAAGPVPPVSQAIPKLVEPPLPGSGPAPGVRPNPEGGEGMYDLYIQNKPRGEMHLDKPSTKSMDASAARRMFPETLQEGETVSRISGIDVDPDLRGTRVGQQLYLEAMDKQGADWYYNSQTEPGATNALKALDKKGLLEVKWYRNQVPAYGQEGGIHLVRVTDKGRKAITGDINAALAPIPQPPAKGLPPTWFPKQ